ncbi:hypothetical protein QR680_012801 [Steinernema hermaphroditum]|uniref:Uncharacterized protein n=1 Tax=Steinernema hermaphroditum TaxID=289476 RepID=A0AA39I4X5_9BILA|nr:hypothetical protein QR680_012801 [Steinernema hermaphroditum]
MTHTVILVLVLLVPTAIAVCPQGCTCRARSIICTCDEASWDSKPTRKSRLVLEGIAGRFDFVESFVVHSCDHVVIPNDTFAGVSIEESLKLVGIGRIDFRPHAFRGIRLSPRHFVVQNAGVGRLPRHSFAGLEAVEHFWWRNVTVASVEALAFADVSRVEYVYFRDARIAHLHRHGFARMRAIGNFYLRGNIHVGRLGADIFDASQIAEVIFEDARVAASDDAHLVAFRGARIAHLQLLSSRFDASYRNSPVRSTYRKCFIEKLTVIGSHFDRISPEALCEIATFENATIASLGPLHAPEAPLPYSATVVNFVHSHIGRIATGAFRSARVEQLRFEKSDIGVLARRAFENAAILRIVFADSSVADAGASEPPPFEGCRFGEVSFQRSFIRASTNLFARTIVTHKIDFKTTHFGALSDPLFIDCRLGNLTVYDSDFSSLKGPLAENTTMDSFDIAKSRFAQELPDDFFSAELATETRSFQMRDSEVYCNPTACEKNALLLRPMIHDLSWKFRRNRCSNAAESPCVELRVRDKKGLACRQRHAIEECVCMGPVALGLPGLRLPPSNASILVLGDCRQITVTSEKGSRNAHVYLYRIEQLEVHSVAPNLRRLEVLHSNVVLEGGWQNRSLASVVLVDSNVRRIGARAFSGAHIERLVFNASQVGAVHSRAFENASVHSMRVVRSRLLDADYSLPQEIAQISIEDSLIEQNGRFFHVDHLDLRAASEAADCTLLGQRIRAINRHFVCGRRVSRSPVGRIAAMVSRCERQACAVEASSDASRLRAKEQKV